MLFNSFSFLVFFPIVTILFFTLPHKVRWFMLLIASCIFYMYFIPMYILILFGTIIIDYIAGIMIEKNSGKKKRLFLILSLIANIGVLAVFKYYNFFISNLNEAGAHLPFLKIILPIGLSFHTFQAMSYTIEVYRGKQAAEKHFGIYALYVMFYPQLVAGPIERPQNVLHQFHERKYFDLENLKSGLRRMLWGLIKKVVIADRLATFTDPVFDHPHSYSGVVILIAAILFAFQIFCDFSGYSDIAIGAAQTMGFKLMTNFNRPYFSRSISEFWKRWHISLSTWFKDYLYIPLGGNRVAVSRNYFNLFIVFLVSGFWHGANWTFIIWGALHGFYLVFALITAKSRKRLVSYVRMDKYKSLNHILDLIMVFALVDYAWIFFRANSLQDALLITGKLKEVPSEIYQLVFKHNLQQIKLPLSISLTVYCIILIAALKLLQLSQIRYNLIEKIRQKPFYFRWALDYAGISLLFFLRVVDAHQFIYFQF